MECGSRLAYEKYPGSAVISCVMEVGLTGISNIPMSSPDITAVERDAVLRVLETPCLSIGPQVEALESELARLAGTRFAVGVSSGTAGLHLAVIAAGLGEADLAITT
jgi:perosamine synthetase